MPPNEKSRPLRKGGSQTGFSGQGKSNPLPQVEASDFRMHPWAGYFMARVDPDGLLDLYAREDLAREVVVRRREQAAAVPRSLDGGGVVTTLEPDQAAAFDVAKRLAAAGLPIFVAPAADNSLAPLGR